MAEGEAEGVVVPAAGVVGFPELGVVAGSGPTRPARRQEQGGHGEHVRTPDRSICPVHHGPFLCRGSNMGRTSCTRDRLGGTTEHLEGAKVGRTRVRPSGTHFSPPSHIVFGDQRYPSEVLPAKTVMGQPRHEFQREHVAVERPPVGVHAPGHPFGLAYRDPRASSSPCTCRGRRASFDPVVPGARTDLKCAVVEHDSHGQVCRPACTQRSISLLENPFASASWRVAVASYVPLGIGNDAARGASWRRRGPGGGSGRARGELGVFAGRVGPTRPARRQRPGRHCEHEHPPDRSICPVHHGPFLCRAFQHGKNLLHAGSFRGNYRAP